ncbi:MAG: acylphosphatase [Euryarchaeota archaeon]|nr:acylphosphatase [Euryarchaeota archaeon]
MEKYYSVTVTGMVQDVGFCDFVENTARSYHLRGFVFNEPDGTVNIQCAGSTEGTEWVFRRCAGTTTGGDCY